MPEMAHAGEDHGEAVLVRRGDHLGIALRAAGLDHGGDAVHRGSVEPVAEREERIGGHHGALRLESLVGGLHRGDARAHHATGMPGADAGEPLPSLANTMAFDLTYLRTGQADVGYRQRLRRRHAPVANLQAPPAQAAVPSSRVCRRRPPFRLRIS